MTTEPIKCVVVTGVAKLYGIGVSVVSALLDAGYAVCGLDVVPLESHGQKRHPLRQLGQATERFIFLHDWKSGDKESTENVVERIVAFARGRLIGLINCGGVQVPYMPDAADSSRWDYFQHVITLNLSGPFLLTELIMPHLVVNESSIVYISSTRALQSEPNCEAFASAAAGLLGLTHSQAMSFGLRGIRVNVILPGGIKPFGEYTATEDEMKWHPSGRVGQPNDVSELCLFLLDDKKSGFITGQQFVVDGGVNMKMTYTSA